MKKTTMQVSDGLSVTIIPEANHEFVMNTKSVAHGYGVTEYVIRKTQQRNPTDLQENHHFVKGGTICHTLSTGTNFQGHQIFWTKKGVIRLGMLIKSERARLFRNWIEGLVLDKMEAAEGQRMKVEAPLPPISLPDSQRATRRFPTKNIIALMAEVCQITDHDLRTRMAAKLMGMQ